MNLSRPFVLTLLSVVALCLVGLRPSQAMSVPWETSPQASVMLCGGTMMNGNHFADAVLPSMREQFAGCKNVALVLYANHPDDRERMEKRLQEAFEHLAGIKAQSIHHLDQAGANALLESADAIFVGGGETFILLGELYRTGQFQIIQRRTLAGVPYFGVSAGANVGGLIIGTTNDFPVGEIPTRRALALFPAVINPHHPLPTEKAEYDARAGKIRGYLRFNPDEKVLGLSNAAFAWLHHGKITITVGTAWLYQPSGVRALKVGDEIPELTPKS